MKNYYKILRLPNFSSQADIKASYHHLAKIYHPDVNTGQQFYHDYFTEIKEAYDFLSSDKNKLNYDKFLKDNPDLFEELGILIKSKKSSDKINNKSYSRIIIKLFLFIVFILFILALIIYIQQNKIFINKKDAFKTLSRKKDTIYIENKNTKDKFGDSRKEYNPTGNKISAKASSSAANSNIKKSEFELVREQFGWAYDVSIDIRDEGFFVNNKNNFSIDRIKVIFSKGRFVGKKCLDCDRFEKTFYNIQSGRSLLSGRGDWESAIIIGLYERNRGGYPRYWSDN